MTTRPQLDLALVLDRSGSMEGTPLQAARRAATAAIASLQPDDRVAVVVYDDVVDVLYPLGPPSDEIGPMLETVPARGRTALHDGWQAGSRQLGEDGRLRRVVLLTDGQANEGLLDPEAIADLVGLAGERGCTTTTLGFGLDYNEELLREMASRGGGNHYYVERASQLSDLFNLELAGLEATLGTRVRLRLSSPIDGVEIRMLDEYSRDSSGAWRLGDLTGAAQLHAFVLLNLPESDPAAPRDLLSVGLEWQETGTREARELQQTVRIQAVPAAEYQEVEDVPELVEHFTLLLATMAQRRAAEYLAQNQPAEATDALERALKQLRKHSTPETRAVTRDLTQQVMRIQAGSHAAAAKRMAANRFGGHGMYNVASHRLKGRLRHLRDLVQAGMLAEGPWADSFPPVLPDRAAGLLRGMAARGGDPAAFACLDALVESYWFEPETIGQVLAPGQTWNEAGLPRDDDDYLSRLGAVVLGSVCFGSVPVDAVLLVSITHRTPAALVTAAAFSQMLFELTQMGLPPAPEWWKKRFLELARAWQPSSGLAEELAPWLDLLAQHADSPVAAVAQAGSPALAALVGTALGALHGAAALPEEWGTAHQDTIQRAVEAFAGS